MQTEEIIRMAREADIEVAHMNKPMTDTEVKQAWLERFAALVAAHERNRLAWTQEHWTQYEHAIAAAEREACAQVCESKELRGIIAGMCAAAIRARGN